MVNNLWDEIAKTKMQDAFIKKVQTGNKKDAEEHKRLEEDYYKNHSKSSSNDSEEGLRYSGDDIGWGLF